MTEIPADHRQINTPDISADHLIAVAGRLKFEEHISLAEYAALLAILEDARKREWR